ncbi:uncharacterized protein F5147DRAFT_647440 [Suillus discolor]|uniref:C2H2-type domain-containing protein n=1 Tax=Suillus discolor TaxID=1912936 RepID=A0A9P7FIZ1_9AGAM|nr:uncharacterized protein F5147DRAFT_647440 [Suillus discolor]KAG2119486.1 hypothetical protein F5147DRAFT_647440 [Suillus discolor]
MDELTCLGCGKTFNSQRHLSAHETLCDTHHEFSKQVSKSYHRVEKSRKNKRRRINHRDHQDVLDEADEGAGIPDPLEDMGDMETDNWGVQDDNIPGPLQRSPAYSPPLPESSAAPQHSNRSGRVIRMPKRYDDFVPSEDVPDEPQPKDVMSEEGDHTGNELISFETEPDTMGLYQVLVPPSILYATL